MAHQAYLTKAHFPFPLQGYRRSVTARPEVTTIHRSKDLVLRGGWAPGAGPAATSVTGAGLLGLVLVVSIIAVLAVLSLSATEFRLDREPPEVASPETGAGGASGPITPSDGARRVACESSYRAIEAALTTRQAASGTPALSVDELVRDGWLSGSALTPGAGITLEVVDGAATGRILVDGRPGLSGCAAP